MYTLNVNKYVFTDFKKFEAAESQNKTALRSAAREGAAITTSYFATGFHLTHDKNADI